MTTIRYTKLTGTGNEFILIDARQQQATSQPRWTRLATTLCDRRANIGADGLLVLGRSPRADVRMRIFNPDGSEPSMCGNGVRCVAAYAAAHGLGTRLTIQTNAGVRRATILPGHRVRVDMGVPRVLDHLPGLRAGGRAFARVDVIDSGVPHLVCWMNDLRRVPVQSLGHALRSHRRFQPAGTNVDFIRVPSLGAITQTRGVWKVQMAMRTYERGVEAETHACGTGAVAAAASVAYKIVSGRQDARRSTARFEIDVDVPGGQLRVELSARYNPRRRQMICGQAFLEGEVRQMTQGTVPWNGHRHR